MASPINSPSVSSPIIVYDDADARRINVALRVTWNAWTSATFTTPGNKASVQLNNLGTIGARLASIRSCIVDNSKCRSTIVLDNGRNWNISVDPGATAYFQIPINTPQIDISTPLGNAASDYTNLVFTNYDVNPQSFRAIRYNFFGTTLRPGQIAGAFSAKLNMTAGASNVTLYGAVDGLVTRLDIDLIGIVVSGTPTAINIELEDQNGSGSIQWAWGSTSDTLPAATVIPYQKIFTLRHPDYIFGAGGLLLVANYSSNLTSGFINVTGVAQ
jgi:hypothetical protein